jgi:transposase, IS5 family
VGRSGLPRPAGGNPGACAEGPDFINRRYRHRGVVDEVERAKNRTKSKVRARVEHSIGVIKRVFGFTKVRYRGLAKNTHRLVVTCALANLFIARRHLLRCQQA